MDFQLNLFAGGLKNI